jgi:hypothetical protein
MSVEVPGSPECARCGGYMYLWRRVRGLTECAECTEARLEILRRGTGAQLLACLLEAATPEECQRISERAKPAYFEDAETDKLLRDIVNAKLVGALWGDAVEKLRKRGELLEARAYRPPRARAHLRGLWGGRRWRKAHR